MAIRKSTDIGLMKSVQSARFLSATHEEIASGATTDIYFVRTGDVLDRLGLSDSVVTADIFARRPGVFCGGRETKMLFDGVGVEILSLRDGEAFSPLEPVMRLTGPYGNFGVFETVVLGILSSSSGWATAAAQCREAAGDSRLICFGARHVHPAIAPVMECAALVGGVDGCSCVLAALLSGISPTGTIPHAAIIIAGDTVEVSKAFDEIMPDDVPRIILVDTFKDEAEEALRVAHALKGRLAGVRLDTPTERGGVTPALVEEVRARLDQEGFQSVRIAVSGGVNPERIRILKKAGAEFFGVGSYISSAPPIEMTMDIKKIGDKNVAKRGRIPGPAETNRLTRLIEG